MAQAGNGPIPGGSAALGNKEPHCAPCLATPHPAPAKSPERGTSWGPGRKEAWGLRAASAPSPPARERASVQGWDGGLPSPHPASERMRRGCWAAAPRHGLGPTRHRPAGHRPASPGQREETRNRLALVPLASLGQTPPLSGGTSCPQPPLPCPNSCQAAGPTSGLPARQKLEAGESCGQSLALADEAQAGTWLDVVMGALGRADPSPTLHSSSLTSWCPYGLIFHPSIHPFIHSTRGSLPLSSYRPNLQ